MAEVPGSNPGAPIDERDRRRSAAGRTAQADPACRGHGVPCAERVDGQPAARRVARVEGAGRGEPAVDGRVRGRDSGLDRVQLGPLPAAETRHGRLPGGHRYDSDGALARPLAAQHARRAGRLRRQHRPHIGRGEDRGGDGADRGRRLRDLVLLLQRIVDRRRRRPLRSSHAAHTPTLSRALAPVAQLERAAAF